MASYSVSPAEVLVRTRPDIYEGWQAYHIAGNFRGAKYSWLNTGPRMKRPTLPTLPTVRSNHKCYMNHELTNIAEPRIF